ncbi:MAG: isoprenylcysteine carboxylmethyltransferase family protein [Bacillota bacterium]|nr:isoprenylcysteine carboxylmethyltransferase family protein [Bacillota bacterium]MDO4859621.1 isoprenylcysteine carboxylmethyltransferase family protein [Bacillota bacterium]
MKNARDIIGYIMGLILFIILIPLLMWKLSGNVDPGTGRIVVLVVLGVIGIALSIWSIVYMKIVGKGNPMDAFNHEVAPRTSELMTGGPYRICRNPMLLGVFIFYTGLVICLWSWQALVIFIAYVAIMMVQVSREEKRLEEDFGEAYREYKRRTKKIIPFIF